MAAKPATGAQPGVAHSHAPRAVAIRVANKEELVQALVGAVDRTFGASSSRDALRWTADLFHQLDEDALRALAYRQGLFEEDVREDEGLLRAKDLEE